MCRKGLKAVSEVDEGEKVCAKKETVRLRVFKPPVVATVVADLSYRVLAYT